MKTIKDHLIDESNISSEYYETKYKIINEKYNKHLSKKPNKIFRKSYLKWEEEKISLENEINVIYNDLLKSYKEIENIIK